MTLNHFLEKSVHARPSNKKKGQIQFKLLFLPQNKPNALSEWCVSIDTKQRIICNILCVPMAKKYQRKPGEQWNLFEVKFILKALHRNFKPT